MKPLEVIIIDDGSHDDNAEKIINSYCGHSDIPIKFFKKENGGPSSARNFGIKSAKGEFIAFVDADDELLIDSIEWRQKKLESVGKDYASIFCSAINCFRNKKNKNENVVEINGSIDGSLVGRKNGIPGGSPFQFFRSEILNEVDGFDEHLKFNEDFELILRISKKWKFLGVNKPGFIRHIRKDSWSNANPNIAYFGVEEFLKIAKSKNLLLSTEISKRKKENRLTLVKKLVINGSKISEVIPYVVDAFEIKKPQNFKEFILFYIGIIYTKIYLSKEK